MAPFVYEPIDLTTRELRILRLLKGVESDDIQCQLFHTHLGKAGNGVPYECLSYVWNGTERTKQVLVDGSVLDITPSLYIALKHLRYGDHERVLWVDAICIDQDNFQERNHQVRQMSSIFSEARQVVFWLGTATPEIDLAMQCILRFQNELFQHSFHSRDRSNFLLYRRSNRADARWKYFWALAQFKAGYKIAEIESSIREGLEQVFRRPWFKRVWIVQEVANARSAVLGCGTAFVSADLVHLVLQVIYYNPPLRIQPQCQAILDIFPGSAREESWWSERRDLSTVLRMFGRCEASDERDKIYALLGISSDACNHAFLRVDYSMHVVETVRKTILFFISAKIPDRTWLPSWSVSDLLANIDFLDRRAIQYASCNERVDVAKALLERRLQSKQPQNYQPMIDLTKVAARHEEGKVKMQTTEDLVKEVVTICSEEVLMQFLNRQEEKVQLALAREFQMVAGHHSEEAMPYLLDRKRRDALTTEAVLVGAAKQTTLSLMRTLSDERDPCILFSERGVRSAAKHFSNILEYLIKEREEEIQSTEKILSNCNQYPWHSINNMSS